MILSFLPYKRMQITSFQYVIEIKMILLRWNNPLQKLRFLK